MLDQRLYEYVYDTESPETNYNLAIEYKKINQHASALSYFLRCAERTTDINLAYECLIHIGNCFDAQGRRVNSAFNSYKQAISILPKRPEAYYHICRLKNWNSVFDDGYTYSSIALDICDFENTVPLNDPGPYTGKHCLLFEKALSAWYWGKVEECKELFLFLWENHWIEMDIYQKSKTEEILKENYSIDITSIRPHQKLTEIELNNKNELKNTKISDLFSLKNYDTDKNSLGYLDHFYDDFFLSVKNIPITMMEIGVCRGGSINLWKDYLNPNSIIYGADINYWEHVPGTYSIIGDMYDDSEVNKFPDGYFDVIIDDGPHSHQSFVDVIQKYYSKIKKNGFLIVEDIIDPNWVEPLYNLCYNVGYSQCEIINMTKKQKTSELYDLWKNGLFILKIQK
jgi:hypothetical protein